MVDKSSPHTDGSSPRKTPHLLRIANASGYWGDDPHALYRQLTGGELDYVTLDFLAEVTMSIMQKQRRREPESGYARDFVAVLEEALPVLLDRGVRLITNAGGVNPLACARAIRTLAERLGRKIRIAVVQGDDILDAIPRFRGQGVPLDNMEDGTRLDTVADRLEAANVYFGAWPIAEALRSQPDIVISGRVTDTGLSLGPMIYEFGWQADDYDRLASGIIAGHILECGCQSTGGNFTDWHKVPSFANMGYPICEMSPDGSFAITKHPGTGGWVSVDTIREQLVYEMGDPRTYITPDVIADFASVTLAADGAHRVRVRGARGRPATPFYKVSMAYRDGFKVTGSIIVCGPEARAKSEAFARIFWERAGQGFEETATEYVGWNACHRSLGHVEDGSEIILRLSARSQSEGRLRPFAKLIPSLILGGPPGVAVLGGVAKPQEVVSYWPALIPKELVSPRLVVLDTESESSPRDIAGTGAAALPPRGMPDAPPDIPGAGVQRASKPGARPFTEIVSSLAPARGHPLRAIALARSGDKGDMVNIGLLARSERAYEYLCQVITAQWVRDAFQELVLGTVTRYTVPNLLGLNFLLDRGLGGGGTRTLRVDAQGKTFAQSLLRQHLEIPQEVLDSVSDSPAFDSSRPRTAL